MNHNGEQKEFCMKCGKYKPVDGRGKELFSHQHWCAECLERQQKTTSAFHKKQAG